MSGRGGRRKTEAGRRWTRAVLRRGEETGEGGGGFGRVRDESGRGRAKGKRGQDPRKRTALSRSRGGGGATRRWIKASTRGGNKERTKKVEEVGGGDWVPWSALIGSTWSDEKFNHPPIPTRPSSTTTPPPPPPPTSSSSTSSTLPLSFSLSRCPYRPPFRAAWIPTR